MGSSISCMNNVGMANNMSRAGAPAPPILWNDRRGGAAWDGYAGMRSAGRAAGRGADSMGRVLHMGSMGGTAEAALNPSRTMLDVGSRSTL